ncbi:uncharacterized protein LOC117643328 [Thrips palmi]|uniref:Uncharacterized protein LOC117643328 n=1 Tax=Thrips palmi TaxID=161013 RepID=A0A6P8YLS1_THRPL|nr:uncharacterized protein LOC117643328 [Thrips palmi]
MNDHSIDISNASTSSQGADQFIELESSATNNSSPAIPNVTESLKGASNQFLNKLYSYKGIPRNFVQTIVSEVTELIGNSVSSVKKAIQLELHGTGVSPVTLSNVNKYLDVLQNPFRGLDSDYLRLKNFKQAPTWVDPEDLVIGDGEDLTACKVIPIGVKMSYIPIAKSLKGFLELPGMFAYIMNYMNELNSQIDNSVSNFIQSKLWKSKIKDLLGIHIPLFYFYDDFCVNNSLGPHSDTGKLGGVYCSIPVLPPKIRSLVDNIFVILLFKSSDREMFSNTPVFCKLIEELKELEVNGIVLNIDGLVHVVHFHLGLIIGDNLGVNSMFDFVSSFTANHCCRFCKIHRDALHFASTEDPMLLRNEDNYSADVITNDPSLTGVIENSVWNSLPNFHVTQNLSVDIMHDLFQGSHNYGCAKGENRPSSNIRDENLKEGHFKMSASEMLSFVMNFSMMVGHLVPKGDPVWYFYTLLRQILDIVLCPYVTPFLCDLLDSVVAEHNHLYYFLFKDTLKPKHHNLVHFSRIMSMVGPLVHTWCMRFESKNRAQTVAAQATRSRKNVTKTLSIREQITQATKKNPLSICDVEFSPLKHLDVLGTDSEFLKFVPYLPDGLTKWMCASYVRCKGTEYKLNSYVYIDMKDNGGLPLFGKICYIIVNEHEDFRLLVSSFDTKYFCHHFHAFVIDQSRYDLKCVKVEELIQPQVFNDTFSEGSLYLTAKHFV